MTLTVYVLAGCWACEGVEAVLSQVRHALPTLTIEIVDIDPASTRAVPEGVFGVPTYVLDGVTVSLGNPSDAFVSDLRSRLGMETTA